MADLLVLDVAKAKGDEPQPQLDRTATDTQGRHGTPAGAATASATAFQKNSALPYGALDVELADAREPVRAADLALWSARAAHHRGEGEQRAACLAEAVALLTEALARVAELAERTAGGGK